VLLFTVSKKIVAIKTADIRKAYLILKILKNSLIKLDLRSLSLIDIKEEKSPNIKI
tara:strand:+ start:365 stop:532 length:168 start_codon:yes stop_codon:yes gene_type:complete